MWSSIFEKLDDALRVAAENFLNIRCYIVVTIQTKK
jgi:hypothetical protein